MEHYTLKYYFSCDPNCVTETVELADWHIIIFANRRINRGEELSYDYKVYFQIFY